MATLSITPAPSNEVAVSVNSTDVTLSQGTTLNVEVTPTPITTINIDQGIIGPTGATGPQGPAGQGVAVGGTTGQVLYKTSNADYATGWETLGTMSSQNANSVAITGGTATNLTNLQSDYLQLDTAAATAIALAKLRWNVDTATASFGIVDGTDEVNIGQQMFAYVTNAESFAITRGQAVYLYQAQGNRASVKLASNLGDATSAKTLGLVAQDSIGANQTGFVITQGQLSKVNTSAFTQGDTLYLGATAGSLTNVKPHAPNHLVYISVVERANAGNGQMYVRPQNGYELEEIHDVQINNPVNGQTIIYDASTDLWKNANLTAGTGVTITNGPSSITISAPDNGTVTNVTGTSPVSVATGTTTPVISMPAATTSVDGYLTSTDWTTFNSKGSGSVTSIGGTGTVSGISLSGTVTSSGSLTLGGTLDLSSPPAIGNTTPNTGKFTSVTTPSVTATTDNLTLSAISTGAVKFDTAGGTQFQAINRASTNVFVQTQGGQGGVSRASLGATFTGGSSSGFNIYNSGQQPIRFQTNGNGGEEQFVIGSTASAVNYVQVTGAVTTGQPTISAQGSDTNVSLSLASKGTGIINLQQATNLGRSSTNWLQVAGSGTGLAPSITSVGGDTNIDLALTPKGTGNIVGNVNSGSFTIGRDSANNAIKFTAPSGNLYLQTTGGGVILFNTGDGTPNQMRVAHTSSAVNYVQVTGAATGGLPTISVQGSDANIPLAINSKGASAVRFAAQNADYPILNGGTGTVSLGVAGTSANIDLALNSKGTGAVRFNTGSGEVFRATDHPFTAGGANVNYIRAFGGQTGYTTGAVANGSDTNITLALSSKGTGSIEFWTAALTARQFNVAHTASAVNYVQVTGGVTGSPGNVLISAQGSDSTVNLNLTGKGGGQVIFLQNGLGTPKILTLSTIGGAVNFVDITPSLTSVAPKIQAQGSDTNIALALTPKGTGALQAQANDGTTAGGNARGANALDFQMTRTAATQVASGSGSIIIGGGNNTASGFNGTVIGGGNGVASGNYTTVINGYNNTSSGPYSVAVTGYQNNASGWLNFIGSGQTNSGTALAAITTQAGTANGTTTLTLSASNASIKIGQLITGTYIVTFPPTYVANIVGTTLTLSQAASGSGATTLSFFNGNSAIVGGGSNTATGHHSFVGGGGWAGGASGGSGANRATGDWATIAGGSGGLASGSNSTIGGGGYQIGNGNTASGQSSTVAGGYSNTVSGFAATCIGGNTNIANGNYGVVGGANNNNNAANSVIAGGQYGLARSVLGNFVMPACGAPIAATQGVSQAALVVLGRQTTDATSTVLASDPNSPTGINQVTLPNNSAYYFRGELIAGVTGGGNTKGWYIEGVIKRGANAASTALVGTPTVTSLYGDAGATTWAVTATADTTIGSLTITVTGQAATTIRWVAQIRTTEMTY
jgi:hypothetical protein